MNISRIKKLSCKNVCRYIISTKTCTDAQIYQHSSAKTQLTTISTLHYYHTGLKFKKLGFSNAIIQNKTKQNRGNACTKANRADPMP